MKFNKKTKYSEKYLELSNCIRILASDAIERANSGHPGIVLGMADVMTSLVFDFLKFNPYEPLWFNRDRLVLSAGHGSMLLYSFYYLTKYKNFNLDDIKQFRKLHSKTPGHPEYGSYEAIETTTGPLGQGFSNSVGMAIAQKKYQKKLGAAISDYKIYCIVGDGCLMEGISYESASLAGHLRLNNLIVLFDDNKISTDGETFLTISENHLDKFTSFGWNVDNIDGHDFNQINASLQKAQNSDKPYFIACRTLIAKGCINKVNSNESHGTPLGKDEITLLKKNLSFKDIEFYIPEELKELWSIAWLRNKESFDNWQKNFNILNKEKKLYLTRHEINYNPLNTLKCKLVNYSKNEATRISSNKVIEELIEIDEKIICGSADLSLSNNIKNKFSKIINKDDFSGNFIHYGVREHAMAGIMNGLAISGFLPIGGTFLVFSDYMKPSLRLAAIMRIHVIYVMTHDSIGVGEDGTTHQPIEHLASMRSIPNLLVLRPADFIETIECWHVALSYNKGPSMLVLTRQTVPQICNMQRNENLCAKGGYIFLEDITSQDYNITIFSSGSELSIALKVKELLMKLNITIRIVSMVCFELFFQQNDDYIRNILGSTKLKVAIEAGSSFGWHRIIGENGLFFGVEQFGLSAPLEQIYKYFGLDPKNIANKIQERLELAMKLPCN